MNTKDNFENFKNIIEEQNILIMQMLNRNNAYLKQFEDVTSKYEHLLTTDTNALQTKGGALVGDYITYYDSIDDRIRIGKIICSDYNDYLLFYPLSDQCCSCCYGTINELIENYSEYEDFKIIHSGKYSNSIPQKTFSYILFKDNEYEGELINLILSDYNGICLYDANTGDVFAKANSYNELICYMMTNFKLIIPLR